MLLSVRPEADLHLHTYYSDGVATPEALPKAAQQRGLKAVAITDHDLTLGNREGQLLAPQYGLELIPALELTVAWEGYTGHGGGPDIDLLAYFVDFESPALARTEARLREGLLFRVERVCGELTKLGFPLSLEDVLETNPYYPGYVPLIKTLGNHVGPQQARELANSVWDKAPASALNIFGALEAVHEMGGAVVLAHPSIVRRQEGGELLAERGLADLKEAGLDGVEVEHYRLDAPQRRHFRQLAEHFGLLTTGGSDAHAQPEAEPRFASEPVGMSEVEALRQRAATYSQPEMRTP